VCRKFGSLRVARSGHSQAQRSYVLSKRLVTCNTPSAPCDTPWRLQGALEQFKKEPGALPWHWATAWKLNFWFCFWRFSSLLFFIPLHHPVRPTDYSSGKNASDRWMFVFFTESWPFICMHHDEIIRARSDVQMVAFVTESRPFFVTESWLFICMRHDEIIRARSGVTWPIHVCDMTRLYSALFEYQVFVCACVAVYCCEIPCVAVCWMKKTAFSACFP